MKIDEALNLTRIPLDLAEKTGINMTKARMLIQSQTEAPPGWGPLHKQKHLISRRHVNRGWPHEHAERIEHYQRLHNQGRINMCQGRDGSYFLLYAMPNSQPIKRKQYFFTDPGY